MISSCVVLICCRLSIPHPLIPLFFCYPNLFPTSTKSIQCRYRPISCLIFSRRYERGSISRKDWRTWSRFDAEDAVNILRRDLGEAGVKGKERSGLGAKWRELLGISEWRLSHFSTIRWKLPFSVILVTRLTSILLSFISNLSRYPKTLSIHHHISKADLPEQSTKALNADPKLVQ